MAYQPWRRVQEWLTDPADITSSRANEELNYIKNLNAVVSNAFFLEFNRDFEIWTSPALNILYIFMKRF